MFKEQCKGNGKHYLEPEQTRKRYPIEKPIPRWSGDICAVLPDGFVDVDIDDYDKQGNPVGFIRGEPRSDVIKRILDAQGVKYNCMMTERGKHFFFKQPENLEKKPYQDWHTPIGIKVEIRPGETHVPIKINGVVRQLIVGSMTNDDIDFLPFWLYPLQKSMEKPINLKFPSGDRTQPLGAYLFHLVSKDFTAEQAFEIVRLMNEYIFEKPIPAKTLEAQILNESTMKKLIEGQREKTDKNISHSDVAREIIDRFDIITVNNTFYSYDGGVYKLFEDGKITQYLTEYRPKLNANFEKEVVRHIKGKTYTEYPEDTGTVNVKNGILAFSKYGTVDFLPHSKENITFKQFNATYDPEARFSLLDETLTQWFSGDIEQIELFNQLLGYLLMNHVNYQKIFFFIGAPATGKNTMLNLITEFCGKDNVSAIQLEDLNSEFGLSSIVNKTANIFSDIRKTKVVASERFKMLADGSLLKINQKYRQPFNYRFTGKLIFGTNHNPDFSHDFEGVERRLIFFTFKHIFKRGDGIYNAHLFEDLLTDECMSELLNRAISGYKSLIDNNGFIETKEGGKALNSFVNDNNNVMRWLYEADITEDYLLREPIKNGFNGLYPEYAAYCINSGEIAKAQTPFSKDICLKFNFETYQKEVRNSGKRERFQMFRRLP